MKVAVVGAGMGGLFTAWRLEQSAQYEVTVYEGSKRKGGRLLTWYPHTRKSTIRGELGGMRYIPKQHPLVDKLVHDLKLTPVLFPATTLFSYLRGSRLFPNRKPEEPGLAVMPPYQFQEKDQWAPGVEATDMLKRVITVIAEHNELKGNVFEFEREHWDEIKPGLRWKGQALSQLGFWNVMLDILSAEGHSFITDGLGYYSLTSNWNAAEAMQFIATDFASDEYFTLTQGYSALATRLAKQLRNPVVTDRSLVAVERVGEQWRLTFKDEAGQSYTTEADRVVLGVPGRALEMINFPEDVSATFARLQPALMRVPAFKLFLLYKENWWEFGAGRFTTTLPIRQTYNFTVAGVDGRPADPHDKHLMVMASYDDMTTVPYWHGLTLPNAPQLLTSANASFFTPGLFSGGPDEGEEDDDDEPPIGFREAPAGMIARAQQQLEEAIGQELPPPYASAYMDWSHDPYGGGWSFWAPGAKVPQVMQEVRVPAPNLYVVGDSFSGIQGWVEGALSFTERVLVDEFGLPPYRPGTYLGY